MSVPVSLPRRDLLRAGALAVPLGVLAACTPSPEPPPTPDPLAALAAQARADAAEARVIAGSVSQLSTAATEVATAREAHAQVLQAEVDRARPPAPSSGQATSSATPSATPSEPAAAKVKLAEALRAAETRAADLLVTVPRYRAGMLASVAAGCACLREVLG